MHFSIKKRYCTVKYRSGDKESPTMAVIKRHLPFDILAAQKLHTQSRARHHFH